MISRRPLRQLAIGGAFLAPNIAGFLIFNLVPLVVSLLLAFTNWDLRLHSMFRHEPLQVVGFENFRRLINEPDFWRFLGNTAFFMLGIPFCIAGSLLLALALSLELRGPRRVWVTMLAATVVAVGASVSILLGVGATASVLLMTTLGGLVLAGGIAGGLTVYRSLLFLPSFTSGVAVFILWKKLYNPNNGPINQTLAPLLHGFSSAVEVVPQLVWSITSVLLVVLAVMVFAAALRYIRGTFLSSDTGVISTSSATALLVLAGIVGWRCEFLRGASGMLCLAALLVVLAHHLTCLIRGRRECRPCDGFGGAVLLAMGMAFGVLLILAMAACMRSLPAMAADGSLAPPHWLTDYYWAKPALMIMGFWSAIGSNNMLLYMAGLAGISPELYEAADIDGATRVQRFWHITWPQLAPTTFFIVVMSVIGGLQGGFEMAKSMTNGGPAGSTTTLSYFIYSEGFETGRLGYSSAAAWMLFVLILIVTLVNWRFGSRYVND